MPFQPQVNQELTIDDATYRIAEHPSAPGIPYGQEGRQAIVYQLVSPSPSQEAGRGGTPSPYQGEGRGEGRVPDRRALKVFKPRYRLPELVSLAGRIVPLAGLSGLQVCQRTVLTPQHHAALLRQHPGLTYAVLMPWVTGPTWMEVLIERRALLPEESLALARSLAEALAGMEQRRLAHCDLSGPNVLLPILASEEAEHSAIRHSPFAIELVDVEQLYGPGLERPELLPGGSPGYAHKTAPDGLWGSTADRFAGAVLLGEMLGWCDEWVREAAWGENYFGPQEMQREGERFQTLVGVLEEHWGAGVAGLFERAWRSEVLADCATFGEWLVMLPEKVPTREAPPANIMNADQGTTGDALRVLMDLGRQFEEQGQLESALQTYRRACELAPAGSGLAGELALIVQDLEAKQTEAVAPELQLVPAEEIVEVAPPVQPPMEEMKGEATAPTLEPPLEEAAVEPVAPTLGSALEKELALIAQGVGAKPQEEAPPLELQPPVVEAEAEVTVPPAGEGADLDRLFDDGLAAYGRGEWAKAKELLREVVRRQPVYERDGYEAARTLLAEAERRLAPARRKRVSGWAWALLGLVFVIAGSIYSNYQAERRALIEALKATALAQYQATVTAQAQATATAQALLEVITPENAHHIQELRVFQPQSWVESVTFSPDGKVLAWAGDGGIWLHDLQQDRLLRHLTGHTAQTHSVVFSPDGTQLYSGGVDEGGGRIRAWDWRTGTELWSVVVAPEGWGALVSISNDGQWLVSSACFENILWRVGPGEPQRYAELSENGAVPAWSPDGKWIAFWESGRVRLIHVGDNESRLLQVPDSPESMYDFWSRVAFSPDASTVASGALDGKIRLWKVSDGTLLHTLDGHTRPVWSVLFSPDGQLLVSESEDNELRLWRIADGALVRTLVEHAGDVASGTVVFSPDGTLLASAAFDGTVRLWGVTD